MKLSNIKLLSLSKEDINKILFENIEDDKEKADYIIVFGNPTFYKERAKKAVELFKENRATKIILTGGKGHLILRSKINKKEARKMYDTIIRNSITKEHIYLEEASNNTYQNVENIETLLKEQKEPIKEIKRIILVSNEYHLKRCYLLMQKRFPKIKFSLVKTENKKYNSDNWHKTLKGKIMIYIELYYLKRFAKKGKIKDERICL